MNNTAIRFGIAAVVVVAAIVAAVRFLPSSNVGGPAPTPTPAATPVALRSADLDVPLAGGRYSRMHSA